MNRIEQAFLKKAFIPFITAGDPSLEITKQLVIAMAEAGADMIELGIPFSDPCAEGVVIQEADYRALSGGVTTDQIFTMVKELRLECNIPLAFMTYVNPIFSYGTKRFMENCKQVGIDALIVPDLPFEEKEEIKPYCDEYGIALISMIAPTSKERIHRIVKEADGFLYCVSSMGVTGVRNELGSGVEDMVKQVKESKALPCAIGFGISTPEQAKQMAKVADGVIVGSAIVKIVGQYGKDCVPYVADYVRKMKEACLACQEA